MSEKRFTIDNTNRIFDNKHIMSKTDVVALLNQLADENQHLRTLLKYSVEKIDEWYGNDYPNATFKVTLTLPPKMYYEVR